jgi:hypothetical protein
MSAHKEGNIKIRIYIENILKEIYKNIPTNHLIIRCALDRLGHRPTYRSLSTLKQLIIVKQSHTKSTHHTRSIICR